MFKIIAVDFDSTIAFDAWPRITNNTKVNSVVVNWIKRRQRMGDRVILWTCRENYGGVKFPDYEYRNDALLFCTRNQVFFHNVNASDGEVGFEEGKYCRKIMADAYIDDRSVPFGRSQFWWKVYLWLMDRKLAKMM